MDILSGPEPQIPLLEADDEAVDGYVDFNGYQVKRSKSGGWRSASFILAGGSLERFAYHGIESNLITYLTGPIEESMATAAANVNTWVGVASLVPVLGAFVADSFIGRYRSIIVSSILYILGLGFLSLTATFIRSSNSQVIATKSAPDIEIEILFFVSLYLVAFAQGYKLCIQAFGADQFDGKHPKASKIKSSFFNWWLCGLCIGSTLAHLILNYIQDNINWSVGFGIPCLSMIVGLILFLLGNKTYRFAAKRDYEENPCWRINLPPSRREEKYKEDLLMNTQQIYPNDKFLNNSLPAAEDYSTANDALSSKIQELKTVLRLLPIWITCLTYTISYAQAATLFTKQAATVDKSIGPNLTIPAATLRTFIPVMIMFCVPIYDKIFVPIVRKMTKHPSGITTLQRIGTGMVISVISMVVAALVEKKRLKTAQDIGLIDIPTATVPMSFWWLVPQYILFGLADVFNQVGIQEFFYDQVPTELRSVGLSFYYGALGAGNFLSSFLVSIIDRATSQKGGESWFSDNLNRAHIDYFYLLLAGVGGVGFIFFLYLSKCYIYVEQIDAENCSQSGSTATSVGDF